MNLSSIKQYFIKNKIPAFRLKQIKQAYFIEGKKGWDEINTLSKSLQQELTDNFNWFSFELSKIQKDPKDQTAKALLKLTDGKKIETVLMNHKNHYTVCVSCQIGCAAGCAFCATGQSGFIRNLTEEEIVDQIVFWNNYLKESPLERGQRGVSAKRVNNIVFMGMGEPFLNWNNVKKSIKRINNPELLNIGQRHITISTSGIIDKIKEFSKENTQINLAISLHSAIDKTRSQIMPINKKYPLNKLITTCLEYVEKTNRKLFFEYLLLQGINDTNKEIQELVETIQKHHLFHLNLIPYNKTTKQLKATSEERIKQISRFLDKQKISYTIRKSFGPNIDAACGQLRAKKS